MKARNLMRRLRDGELEGGVLLYVKVKIAPTSLPI